MVNKKPPLTFADFRAKERGRVIGFIPGEKQYRHKLLAMGLTPNTEFTVVRIAPLGDPIEIQLRGFSLSIRKAEAQALQLEKLS